MLLIIDEGSHMETALHPMNISGVQRSGREAPDNRHEPSGRRLALIASPDGRTHTSTVDSYERVLMLWKKSLRHWLPPSCNVE